MSNTKPIVTILPETTKKPITLIGRRGKTMNVVLIVLKAVTEEHLNL